MAVVFNCRPNGDKAFGDAVAAALDKGSAAVKKSTTLPGRARKKAKKRKRQ